MEAVKTEYATLQNMMSNGASGNEIVNQFEKVNSVLKETQNSLKQTKAEYKFTCNRISEINTCKLHRRVESEKYCCDS